MYVKKKQQQTNLSVQRAQEREHHEDVMARGHRDPVMTPASPHHVGGTMVCIIQCHKGPQSLKVTHASRAEIMVEIGGKLSRRGHQKKKRLLFFFSSHALFPPLSNVTLIFRTRPMCGLF